MCVIDRFWYLIQFMTLYFISSFHNILFWVLTFVILNDHFNVGCTKNVSTRQFGAYLITQVLCQSIIIIKTFNERLEWSPLCLCEQKRELVDTMGTFFNAKRWKESFFSEGLEFPRKFMLFRLFCLRYKPIALLSTFQFQPCKSSNHTIKL